MYFFEELILFWYTQLCLDPFDSFEACFQFLLSQVQRNHFTRDHLILLQKLKTSEDSIKFPVNYKVSPH